MTAHPEAVVVMGPAWHSCGSHQLYKAQIAAYSALGFRTYFLAVAPTSQVLGLNNDYWDYYLRMTPDIDADVRGEARLRSSTHRLPSMLLDKLRAMVRSICYIRSLTAKHAVIPGSMLEFLSTHSIKAIHCNHFFNLPLARRIAGLSNRPKIICETQDIQTRHFIASDPVHPYTGKKGTYDDYFEDEVKCLADADEFVHLNEEEFCIVQNAIPSKPHHLIYPSVARPILGENLLRDIDFLIVSSANLPNYHSLRWFLEHVWDDELNQKAKLRIIGNIDYVFQTEKDQLYMRYGPDVFQSRVENVADWYARTKVVLAPVTEGQGISIKTIEALASGRPFLFSPMALRGFSQEPLAQKLEGKCSSAKEFKSQLYQYLLNSKTHTNESGLALYNSLFAPESYIKNISRLIS